MMPYFFSNSQPELPSTPSPVVQLPRLYPIFPADGSKGDSTIDIIAVHGIETTSSKTWTAYERDTEPKGRSFYWLKDADMLPSVIKGARIWVFDYNSNYSHNAQTVRIDGLAATLLNCIKDRHDDFESRKFVFIGSCFGGIVVAEALLAASREREDERKKTVFRQTAGVIFLGSPLRGTLAATFAGWQNFVFGILDPNQGSSCTLLDDLKANSSRLENLVTEFGKLTVRNRMQAGMEIRCFYETRKTQLLNAISRNSPFKPQEILLVDRVSACLDCHEHIPLDVRHAMMNKYRGPEDPNFKLVSGRIKDVVDKIRADRSLTREEKECMQALSFHYQDQKDINPERVQGTCEWFLKHPKFLAWCRNTIANLLWVTAGPGCGKSVLSKALVDEGLLNPENPDTKTTSICYYFFKDDAERGSGVNALRSILHQLFKQKLWLIQHAINDYSTDGPNLSFGTLWAILMKAVSDTNAGPVICVLDALDECETSTRKSLIKNISSFHCASKTTSSTLKFILTSRPYHELDIDFKVDDLPSIHLEGNQMSEEIRGEIDLVISHEISRIGGARQPPLDGEIQASLIQHLQDQKNRTYLWVYLMLQEISKSLESTERKLIELLRTIPSSVDEAYEKILKRATDPSQAQKVLCLILAAERPLTLKEMNTALEVLSMNERGEKCTSENDLVLDKEEAFRKKIVNLCGLFVTIVDSKIYLIHQTAKEFLINKNGSTNPWSPSCWKYAFTLQASHLEALKACLSYLRLDFQDIPSGSRKDHPLLLYTSIYWTFHFQQAGEKADKELGENALQICNTKTQTFLFWYRILRKNRPYDQIPTENNSDLLIACCFGLTSVVQILLWDKPNIDIESKDTRYNSPLSWASYKGHVEVIKLLLKKEADVNTVDKEGWTPLHLASFNRHIQVVKLLLEKEADVNTVDEEGRTPLYWASESGHIEVVKLLLDKKADINTANKKRYTPLHWASGNGHIEVVKLLLDKEANVNAADKEGSTPLHWATWEEHVEVIKLLLGVSKVKADSKDIKGQTPLSYATERGYEAIVKLLLEHIN